uniref:Uncharacterized protein n=1 Tax=Vitis vinifera TaxID=29760 RepID=F6HVQ3_VITVI
MKIGKELAELDMCSIGSDGVSYRESPRENISQYCCWRGKIWCTADSFEEGSDLIITLHALVEHFLC